MSASDEWEEVHLTPNGWLDGSFKHDFGHRANVAVPVDAVLTVRRHVYVGAIGASPQVTETKQPLTGDKELIERLLSTFGKPEFGV